jgi:hypothetical protein
VKEKTMTTKQTVRRIPMIIAGGDKLTFSKASPGCTSARPNGAAAHEPRAKRRGILMRVLAAPAIGAKALAVMLVGALVLGLAVTGLTPVLFVALAVFLPVLLPLLAWAALLLGGSVLEEESPSSPEAD